MPSAHRRTHRPDGPRVVDQPDETASRLLKDQDGDAAQHLENLRVALRRLQSGLYVRLERPSGRHPHLRVMGTGSNTSSDIFYRIGADGGLGHYVGDRGQVLAAVDDLEQAGLSVLRALGIRGRRSPFRALPDRDHADLELIALPNAVSCAREHVIVILRRWRLVDFTWACRQAVSELVSNAIAATGSLTTPDGHADPLDRELPRIMLRARLTDTQLVFEVWDSSENLPALKNAGDEDEEGRGLRVVKAVCSRWGTYQASWPKGGKVVWAVWDLPTTPTAEAA